MARILGSGGALELVGEGGVMSMVTAPSRGVADLGKMIEEEISRERVMTGIRY